MKIKLLKLTLLNFKGVRSLDVDFNDVTNIFGDNATGKTTVFDGFLWLLFGKDSTDRKDFEIKTLGPDNKPFHRMDHEVSAVITVDGIEINLKRVFKEKWTKKRGDLEHVFTGHETSYYWNDVPMKQEEYQSKISGLVDENIFKLITNTGYFNSRPWQERRNVLLQFAGDINTQEIFDTILNDKGAQGDIIPLMNALNADKTIEQFKREVSAKKKKIKDELDQIPSRIDEANRSLPDLLNYDELENSLKSLQTEFAEVEGQLLNKTEAQKQWQQNINNKIAEVQKLRSEAMQIEFNEKNKVQNNKRTREQTIIDLKRDLRNKLDESSRNAIEIANNNSRKKSLLQQQETLRAKWTTINNEALDFKDDEFSCPACKRAYEATDIEVKKKELISNFNQSKSLRLESVTRDGKQLTAEVAAIDEVLIKLNNTDETIRTEIVDLKQKIADAEEKNAKLSQNESLEVVRYVANNADHKAITDKIKLLNEDINTPQPSDNQQPILLQNKNELAVKIDAVKKELSTKEQRERIEKRIEELKKQEKDLGQELANQEGIEFSILQFEKTKMDMLESRINGRFQIVTFKLSAEQINGGEVPCCETLIKGVPYQDANNASKIQAGLDIINTLSDHFQVTAPVFIDNRESVVTLPESKSQIISLIVSAPDKKLRIDSVTPAMSAVA